METKLLVGIIAGTLTAISTLPQIIKALKTKKVDHISPFMFIILLMGNGTWVGYGVLLKDLPIIITNSFSFLMAATMLTLKFVFQNKRNE